MEKLLTIEELSEHIQIGKGTIYFWTHTEFIPHYKLGKHLRFKERDISEWLEKRRINGRRTLKYEVANL